jgi:hypothetical protein
MEKQVHYATVSEAINKLRAQGFTEDFNISGELLKSVNVSLDSDEFEIVDVYRYEGNSDPADEAVVYAIQSATGVKGILVSGFGISADSFSSRILAKLSFSH